MRTFLRGRWARVIAQALTLTFLWSAAFLCLPVPPAKAQIAMRTAATQSVAVVPFDNRSRFGAETLGQEAAEAVTVELRERLLLDVLPGTDVELVMHDLSLKVPLSDSELVRLATELEVTMVVAGELRAVDLRDGRGGRRAHVTLAVVLFDRVAEDTVNGALVDVVGPAVADGDDMTLVRKAIEQAAFEAVREMRTRPTITATVLWNREDTVYVSAGSRAGLKPGTQMAVIRSGQRLGLVEITSADPLGAYARLVSGPQLRPGDRLRAIYRLPSRVRAPLSERVAKKKRGIEKLLIGAAALLGLGNISSTARLLGEGDVAAPAFTASNLANGREHGYTHTADFGYYGWPTVLLTWGDYDDPYEGTRLLGYEIWSDTVGLVEVISTTDQAWYDQHYLHYYNGYPDAYKEAGFTIDSVTGEVDFYNTLITLDPDEDPPDMGVFWEEGSDNILYDWWPFSPPVGVKSRYAIRPVLAKQDIDGFWTIDRGTELSTGANTITPVLAPLPSNVYLAGMTATFEFYTSVGADEAIIQIARGPLADFDPDRVYSHTALGIEADPLFGYGKQFVDVDLNQVIGLPGSGDKYYYRIGCRNHEDSTYPQYYPGEQPQADPSTLQNEYYWVWSDVKSLTLVAPSRDLAVKRERDALARSLSSRSRVLNRTRRDRPLRIH